MKKEVFVAISIGFVLGLIITFGIWTANKSLKSTPSSPVSPTEIAQSTPGTVSSTPTPAPSGKISLTLSSPDEETLTGTTSVTVSGNTSPGAVVAVLYETGALTLTADSSGKFSTDVPLEGGYNFLTITAADSEGNQTVTTRTITYSTQKI